MGKLEGFATNSFFVWCDRTGEAYKGFNKGRWWMMRNRDLDAVVERVSGIAAISPVIFGGRGENNIAYGEVVGSHNVKGVMPGFFEIMTTPVLRGRLLNDIDMREHRKVCIIGHKLVDVFFRGIDPVGCYLRVNGIYYQVVGVVTSLNDNINIGGRTSEGVMLPFTTMQRVQNLGDQFYFMSVSVYRGYSVDRVIEEVSLILRTHNSISPADIQAIGIANLSKEFGIFDLLFSGITALVWLVGMGTLLAGVIGVSNIMMVTVKERTREIGIRRALGARPLTIISQVISESLVLTSLAGLLGLTLGVFILDIVNRILLARPPGDGRTFFADPSVDIGTALVATLVLLFSGLLAGLIPAWRAMQIKAIDAIREE
jgi:putative ABC transport system permease protein